MQFVYTCNGRKRVINDQLIIFAGADERHLHEGRVLADAAEGAEQREEPQGAHDPLSYAAQGNTSSLYEFVLN